MPQILLDLKSEMQSLSFFYISDLSVEFIPCTFIGCALGTCEIRALQF